MFVSPVRTNKLCKPAGINKEDSSSARVADEVAEQMDNNGASGVTEVKTGPGDTLESVAKGSLKGTGQKIDTGSLIHEQKNIVSENYKDMKHYMKEDTQGTSDPNDLKTFKGRELPQGMSIKLTTQQTQHSMNPTNIPSRSGSNGINDPSEKYDFTQPDEIDQLGMMDQHSWDNFYAGAENMSDTGYALEMFNVGVSKSVKAGMVNYLSKKPMEY